MTPAVAWAGTRAGAAWLWKWRTPALALLLGLAVAGWLRACGGERAARGESAAAAARAGGEEQAHAAGIPVVVQVPVTQVDAAAEKAKAENPVLRARLVRAEKELGKLRILLVAHLQGEPGKVDAPARPDAPGDEAKPVELRKGDELVLGADLVVGESKPGAHVLEGALFADRKLDGVRLSTQPYSASVTWAVQPRECPSAPEPRRWHAGPEGSLGTGGPMAGAAGTYRLHVFGWEPEGLARIEAGSGGARVGVGLLF